MTFLEHGIACDALITPGSALARNEAFVHQSWSLECDQHGGCANGAAAGARQVTSCKCHVNAAVQRTTERPDGQPAAGRKGLRLSAASAIQSSGSSAAFYFSPLLRMTGLGAHPICPDL